MTPEEQAAFDAATAKATELEGKFTELQGKAKELEGYKVDMLKYKEELAAQKLKDEENSKKGLLEKEQYKVLYEKTEVEKNELQKKSEESILKVDRFIKQGAIEAAALQAGVRKEALGDFKRLAGFDSLEVKTEGDDIKVLGVEALITEQKKLRPYLFSDGKPPKFNDPKNAGGGGDKDYTTAELIKLQKEDPAAYRKAMEENQKKQQEKQKK